MATLDDLAEYLAARGSDRYRNDPTQTKTHLHHWYLPELDDIGIIDYEPESKLVRTPQERALPADLKELVFELDADD